ncbi:MAG: hypothetical protein P0Y53_14950 [Candidatus Pseudobacter hemicellulosilyticus]|uniref:Uncharacterized protein n=1 Tax=Candidatus Pseudobacter hemicellulosilyticus TaxID=3121375 RepID=A0AAJ5WNT3_9BACT|nr:MAG: hypothetical protein P0Y53_14950 [Pseudobacter sp.]
MKTNKKLILAVLLMVVVAAVYRVIPGRPLGFAPQLAIALFSGAIFKDRKLAFSMPLLSILLSDLLYQVLYMTGASAIPGFYDGQWINYILLASVTVFGLLIRRITVTNVLVMSLLAPTYFFLVSNFLTWVGVGAYIDYPKTWAGLMTCYTMALPFYKGSIMATLVFSTVLFGSWYLVSRKEKKTAIA